MGGDEIAHANWRLDNPPVVDVAVSRRMGLFVVARLAARHGIRVRLRPATGAGLTALVWLPDEVVAREATTKPGGLGRFPEPLGRFAIGGGPAGITGGAPAGPGGAAPAAIGGMPGSGEWPAAMSSTAEQEVAAARTPRFAPQEDEAGTRLGPQRVPGAGPHPGRFGPPNGPGLAGDPESTEVQPQVAGDMFGTEPTPMFGAGHPSVPSQPFDNEWSAPFAAGSGEQPSQPAAEWGSRQPDATPSWSSDQTPSMWSGSQPAWPAATEEQAAQSGTGDLASQPAEAGSAEEPEPAALGARAGFRGASGTFRSQDSQHGSRNGGVIIPPAASLEEGNRLPIFEAVESDWFRRGRPSLDVSGGDSERPPTQRWSSSSVADEGWKAAEAAAVPSSSGTTVAGLPKRVPRANLIPGTAAESTAPAPARSAAATRDRFASLQRGMREGRAASGTDKDDGTGDVPGDG
jgi:hypothetical protein